uniref:Sperm associated antigen 6 n=1 Tax=Gouania willdenowi TaxID=441366 RepID=A0A8C5GF91_GOUWI
MESTLLNQKVDMESSSDRPTMIQQQMIEAYDRFLLLRTEFMQTFVDLSKNPQNMNFHQKEKIISQFRLLTMDEDPSIQHNAVVALGHLVEHSEELAMIVVKKDILGQLIKSIPSQDQHYKKAAAFVLRAVANHSPELSQAVVDCGGLDALGISLKDPEVKEAAAWAPGNIAQQDAMPAQAVVDADAVSLPLSLNTSELVWEEVNMDTIALLVQMIRSPDAKVKRQVLSTLIQITKHSVKLAEMVIAEDIFSEVMVCLQDPDEYVKTDVITLMWEVVRHNAEFAQRFVNCGGLAEVVDYLDKSHGSMRIPGIMVLGCVASHGENLAMAVILSKGLHQLAICLSEEDNEHIKGATVWSIGQIGHHTPEHAKAVATAGLLPKVLLFYTGASSLEKSLKNILLKCTHLPSLEPLLNNAPSNILNHVLGKFSKVLPHDSEARQEFVMSGGLSKVQEMKAEPGSALWKQINAIKSCFQEAPANRLKAKSPHEKPQTPQAKNVVKCCTTFHFI